MNEDQLLDRLRRHDPVVGKHLQSASEAQEELRRILATEVKTPSSLRIQAARLWTPADRRAATVIAALLIALVGVLLPLWALRSAGPTVGPAAPSDGLLAFAGRQAGTERSDIYIVSPDGTGSMKLTNDPADEVDPAWSPDGTQMAFARDEQGDRTLYVMDADGGNLTRLGSGSQPAWSPTGERIVYMGPSGISVINSDGSDERSIRDDGPDGVSGSPAWSPNGQQIAFLRTPSSDPFGFAFLYVMDADGRDVRRVSGTTTLSITEGIAWSPDGDTLLFTGGDSELHSVRPDGNGERVLTDAASQGPGEVTGSSIDPAWSSDGEFIAFLRDPIAGQDYEVFTMRADGTAVHQVTDDTIEVSGLSWQWPKASRGPRTVSGSIDT